LTSTGVPDADWLEDCAWTVAGSEPVNKVARVMTKGSDVFLDVGCFFIFGVR
jgi:hypothetical protein